MLGVKDQGQVNLQNSENIEFHRTNSKTTLSSPPLESNIPDKKIGSQLSSVGSAITAH